MDETRIISLLLELFLILLALGNRLVMGSWFAPGAFFALAWSAYILFPLLLMPEYSIHPAGIIGIIYIITIVSLGSLLGTGRFLRKYAPLYTKMTKASLSSFKIDTIAGLDLKLFSRVTLLLSILGAGSVIVLILSSGHSMSSLFSLNMISEIGREYSVARYSDVSYREPGLSIFLSSFIFSSAFLGGALYNIAVTRRQRLIALLPLIIAALHGLMLTTRASIFFTGIIWIGSYFSMRVAINKGRAPLFTWKNIILSGCTAILLIVSYIFLQSLRWGIGNLIDIINLENINQAIPMLSSAFLGSPVLFSQWFADHWQDNIIPTLGLYTTPVIKYMAVNTESRFESTQIGIKFGDESTVFTLFRDMSEDYTIPGTILLLFIIGFIGGVAFRRLLQERIKYLPVLAAFYCITISSLTGFLFRYTTTLSALFIFVLYFTFAVSSHDRLMHDTSVEIRRENG